MGYDVRALEGVTIRPGELAMVRTGVHVTPPPGCFVTLYARSSLCLRKHCVLGNAAGIIDPDFTGGLMVPLLNYGGGLVMIGAGERIAQLVVQPYETPAPTLVEALPGTERGAGGFGSTGAM